MKYIKIWKTHPISCGVNIDDCTGYFLFPDNSFPCRNESMPVRGATQHVPGRCGSLHLYPLYPEMVIAAGEDEIVQSGSLLAKEPYQQLLIYPVAYGLVPAASNLPLSEEGASYFYKEKTMEMMFSEGENIIDIPPMDIFDEEVKPFAAITPRLPAGWNRRSALMWSGSWKRVSAYGPSSTTKLAISQVMRKLPGLLKK